MRPTTKEQHLADRCAKRGDIFFCANYIGRLTDGNYKNTPVFAPSFDDSIVRTTGLPAIIIVNNNEAQWIQDPLSSEYLRKMVEDRDYSLGEEIFHEIESLLQRKELTFWDDYKYIASIVEACSKTSYQYPIEKQTMFLFLEMAARFNRRIKICPVEGTGPHNKGSKYYLKLVTKEQYARP